jgi:hypothetical protein
MGPDSKRYIISIHPSNHPDVPMATHGTGAGVGRLAWVTFLGSPKAGAESLTLKLLEHHAQTMLTWAQPTALRPAMPQQSLSL